MSNLEMLTAALLTEVRNKNPLVHQITNYVTVNDCANITLAIGASPIMADDISETEEITSISSALVLNIGTLNERTIASMVASGKKANEMGIPVIFDPVGAGASPFRNYAIKIISEQVNISVLRGNLSELAFIAGLKASTRGVDASEADSGHDRIFAATQAARKLNCVTALTGAVDIITNGSRVLSIHNGHKLMSRVTGTGCMATALIGAFSGVTSDYLLAAGAGIASMGIAGETAFDNAGKAGTGSYRTAIIDAISRLDEEAFSARAEIHEV